MRQLILFILDWVRSKVDKDYAADLAAYQLKRKQQQDLVEAESKALAGDMLNLATRQWERKQVALQIEQAKEEVAELDRRREEIRSDRQKKLDDLNRQSADELRSAPL